MVGPRQDESATTQLTTDIDQTITIIGLKENVGRAKQELENKITQLQVCIIGFQTKFVPFSWQVV